MKRVICIGNRFYYPDNFGILIYEELKKMDLPYEVVEGGVGGMSLSPYFEDDAKILIVDYAKDFDKKILNNEDIQKIKIDEYNHSNAFLYFLKTVKKPFTVFVANRPFKDIKPYINEILSLAEKL